MKNIFRINLVFHCFLVLVFTACSGPIPSSLEEDGSFNALFPIDDMNKSIQMVLENRENAVYKFGSDIDFVFENFSDRHIYFSTDTFIMLLVVRDGNWVEIGNKNTYSGEILLFPSGTPLADNSFLIVRPVLDNMVMGDLVETVRVVLIGELYENNTRTGKLVGSYVDVLVSHE